MLGALAALSAAFTMPTVDFTARRLILVHASPSTAIDDVAAHVSDVHGDDVRFLMTSSSPEALELASKIETLVSSKIVGRLSISQSDALNALQDGETAEDCATRSLQTRDYVLRGTMPGAASVLISHEDPIQFLLARAANLEAEMEVIRGTLPESAVSVLDFGDGTFPDVRAAPARPRAVACAAACVMMTVIRLTLLHLHHSRSCTGRRGRDANGA